MKFPGKGLGVGAESPSGEARQEQGSIGSREERLLDPTG